VNITGLAFSASQSNILIDKLIYNGTIQVSTGSYTVGIVCQQSSTSTTMTITNSLFNTTVTCSVQTGLISNVSQTTINMVNT